MLNYPMKFPISAQSTAGTTNNWSARTAGNAHYTIDLAIPPEFAGPGGAFSPEDIYALALGNCFVATFKVFAEKSSLSFSTLDVSGELTVDRDEKGVPWMAEMALRITLKKPSDAAKAERLLEKTAKSCMIINSVKTKVSFSFQVED